MQLTLNWNPVHAVENNHESQQHLNNHRDSFNGQCWELLVRMLGGERLTMKSAINSGISDVRRRAKDLKDGKGIPVKCEWAIDEKGNRLPYKEYYIAESDRQAVYQRVVHLIKK